MDRDRSQEPSNSFVPEVLAAIVFLGIAATPFVIPKFARGRSVGNGTRAIGTLKTIGMAQSLFREADKESDGNLDYGTLAELATAGRLGLVDSILGSGTKNGYFFEATYGSATIEFIWFATARPALPGVTGHRYFCTNHEGVTYYTVNQPFRMNNVDCTVPAGATPVGR